MKWSSALSENLDLDAALRECHRKIEKEIGAAPDLAILFLSPHYLRFYQQIPSRLLNLVRPKLFVGCSAGGIIGGGREVEQKPALSLTGAILPEVELVPFHVSNDALPDMDARPKTWQDLVKVSPEKQPQFILFSDPFSMDVDKFAMGLDYAFPKSVKVGGLASSARAPGENILFLNQNIYREGLVGAALSGNLRLHSIVAQGCRPIGEAMIITGCEQNLLLELDQKPPMKILEELYETLPTRDQQLLRTSLFLGFVMDPTRTSLSRGDFLIRNIIGADPERGVLAVGTELRQGQTVQFHLRDAQTSAEDLELMLSRFTANKENKNVKGALLFSCMGRGIYLYGTADHDTKLFQKKIGNIPLGGFFCNGEIGPVNHTTYIHGYTSCFALFSESALKHESASPPAANSSGE